MKNVSRYVKLTDICSPLHPILKNFHITDCVCDTYPLTYSSETWRMFRVWETRTKCIFNIIWKIVNLDLILKIYSKPIPELSCYCSWFMFVMVGHWSYRYILATIGAFTLVRNHFQSYKFWLNCAVSAWSSWPPVIVAAVSRIFAIQNISHTTTTHVFHKTTKVPCQ